MPGASSARLLCTLVLCTISTTTTASAVVLVDGFLTGKSASRSPERAPRRLFRLDEIVPLRAPAQIRGEKSSPEIDAGLVAALQACCLESPAALVPSYVECSDASLSSHMHFCWNFPHMFRHPVLNTLSKTWTLFRPRRTLICLDDPPGPIYLMAFARSLRLQRPLRVRFQTAPFCCKMMPLYSTPSPSSSRRG